MQRRQVVLQPGDDERQSDGERNSDGEGPRGAGDRRAPTGGPGTPPMATAQQQGPPRATATAAWAAEGDAAAERQQGPSKAPATESPSVTAAESPTHGRWQEAAMTTWRQARFRLSRQAARHGRHSWQLHAW